VDIGPHVFPTVKYRLVRDRLVADQVLREDTIQRPQPASDQQVALVHTPEYMDKIKQGALTAADVLRLEVPFSPSLRDAAWLCAGGSLLTARLALEAGVAIHLGGGFHHAFPDHGEGFCLINDVAVAIQALRHEGRIGRAVVIDCDVHHGNGTAAAFAVEPDVFTFSMHQEANYPAWKPPGDLDLGLADGTGDHEYLELLDQHLNSILAHHRPDLAFYLAGADPYEHDQLGGLALSLAGLRRRDELVLQLLGNSGVAAAIVLAGGYAFHLNDTVEIHCNTARAAHMALTARA
jgi:acetoin utilization deacetylase AcuC-like enzyme